MAVSKLSQITSSGGNADANTGLVGVETTGPTDLLFSPTQLTPALTKASASVFGIVQVDGSTITASGGVISSSGSSAPLAGSNLNFYVSTTGSDSNPGTVGSPFATIQHAVNVAASFNYEGLYFPTVNVANGTYHFDTTPVNLPEWVGANQFGGLIGVVVGNTTTPTNVVLTDDQNFVGIFNSTGGLSQWMVEGFEVDTGASAFVLQGASFVQLAALAVNDTSAGGFMTLFALNGGGTLGVIANTTISFVTAVPGGLAEAFDHGVVRIQTSTLNFQASTVWTGSSFDNHSTFRLILNSYTNFTGTGNRGACTNHSSMLSDNGVFADLPGNSGPTGDETSSFGKYTSFASFFANQLAGIPSTSNIPAGCWGVWKDTSGGGVYAAYNDAGTIKKVALT